MSDATDLWAAVVVSYDAAGLTSLSNINDRSATTVNTARGEDAATAVLALWPSCAQVAYDGTDALHLEAAKQGVIAILQRRGGGSTSIARVKWDDVFAPGDGLIAKIRNTGPRGRQVMQTNSGVASQTETVDGRRVLGWSDRATMPRGIFPSRRTDGG